MNRNSFDTGISIDIFEIDDPEEQKTEIKHHFLLGYYDYTVILTYAGMLTAFAGILFAINESFRQSVICLMLAGICDMFDGTVASTKSRTKKQKRFGIQIDSMSDIIAFGVLPAVTEYMLLGRTVLASVAACIYVLLALIRLSYFNVLEEDRQNETCGKRTDYLGVPVTTMALLFPLVYLLYKLDIVRTAAIFPTALLISGILFITAVKVRKPENTGKFILLAIGAAEIIGIILI